MQSMCTARLAWILLFENVSDPLWSEKLSDFNMISIKQILKD